MIFDPKNVESFRYSTAKQKMHGVCDRRRFCCKCKQYKLQEGGISKRGYSRHEPAKFICAECR